MGTCKTILSTLFPAVRPVNAVRRYIDLLFLFRQLLRREVASRYKATALGSLWIVAQPLLMLVVYTVVFNGIFQVRWSGVDSRADFALVLFAGLIVFNLFAEVLVSSPALVSANPNYVKKVVFPLEMLAAVRVGAAYVAALASLILLALAQATVGDGLAPSFLLAALVLVAMVPFLLGIAWLLSGLGVYLPDLSQIVGIVASVMLFVSPLFFPASAIPSDLSILVEWNPLVIPIEQLRAATTGGDVFDLAALSRFLAGAMLFCGGCFLVFRRLAKGFADVL